MIRRGGQGNDWIPRASLSRLWTLINDMKVKKKTKSIIACHFSYLCQSFKNEVLLASSVGSRPPRLAVLSNSNYFNIPRCRIKNNTGPYLLLFIIIICGTNPAPGLLKDSISKWNHFFIEMSSCTDINYVPVPRTRSLSDSLFVLPFGMLYKSILFSNYFRRSTGNFNVNSDIIHCSD